MPDEGTSVKEVSQSVYCLGAPVLRRLDGNGDGVNVRGLEVAHVQASLDGLFRECPGVLVAREPLLLDHGRHAPVHQQAGGGIVKEIIETENVHC